MTKVVLISLEAGDLESNVEFSPGYPYSIATQLNHQSMNHWMFLKTIIIYFFMWSKSLNSVEFWMYIFQFAEYLFRKMFSFSLLSVQNKSFNNYKAKRTAKSRKITQESNKKVICDQKLGLQKFMSYSSDDKNNCLGIDLI